MCLGETLCRSHTPKAGPTLAGAVISGEGASEHPLLTENLEDGATRFLTL